MNTKIVRTPHYQGTEKDFMLVISGMSPIVYEGVNEDEISWWIHPTTCTIVHLIRIVDRAPFEAQYVWTKTVYDPLSTMGFTKAGYKMTKVAGRAYPLHRIMASTFIPNDNPTWMYVIHKDGNIRNNKASNLSWGSYSDAHRRKKKRIRIRLNLKKGDEL